MSAAIQITGVTSKIMSTDKPMAAVKSLVKTLTSEMVRIQYIAGTSESTCPSIDSVQEYAKETLSLGLLLLEFKDGIREGDGNRVLRCWKYFLLFFRATKHKNYCTEAFNIQMQYYYILPKRYAEKMLWGRFINSEGGPGHNIPEN